MNRVTLIGRLTTDPEIIYSHRDDADFCIAHFTLAVNRRDNESADFLRCVAFGKSGEFAEKYLNKGIKMAIEGRLQTGSYEDRDGNTRYTTDVIVENMEFCEKKTHDTSTSNSKKKYRSTKKNYSE